VSLADFTRARDRLLGADTAERSSTEVCEEIVRAFHDIACFEWCAVMTMDPGTLLPSGGVVEGFAPDACEPFWDNELLDPDFNKFTDLARSTDPVVTLAEATDGDVFRSPRYARLYAPLDAADELRIALTAGTACLAVGVFVRPGDAGVFTPEEIADTRQLVPVATKVLRRALGRLHAKATSEPPAVILLDGEGKITAMSAGGRQVLDDIRIDIDDDDELPNMVRAAATKARWSRAATNLTTRLRSRSGRWFRLHVAPMDGDAGTVVLTVEAARPDDVALILLDSYDLTQRETEIVLRLCQGLSTKEIAAEVMISAHTVRDHVKTIFEKTGVNSRAQLVASLFSNHLLDRFHQTISHVGHIT
jgi:DNA-binding CsgD family transcriptional regulator